MARKDTTIWHEAVTSDIDLPFDLESVKEAVEKFFHNESKTAKEVKKDDSKVKKVHVFEITLITFVAINLSLYILSSQSFWPCKKSLCFLTYFF